MLERGGFFHIPAFTSLLWSASRQLGPETTSLVFYLLRPPVESSKSLFWLWQLPVHHPNSITGERERERKHFSFTFTHKGAAAREWQQERCFSLFSSDSLGLSGEYHQRSAASSWLLHWQPFLFEIFSLSWDFDRTAARGDISFFYFYHFDLIIMPLVVPGSGFVSCFQSG